MQQLREASCFICGRPTSPMATIWAQPGEGKVLSYAGKKRSLICGLPCAREAAHMGYDVGHTAAFHKCPACVAAGFPTGSALVAGCGSSECLSHRAVRMTEAELDGRPRDAVASAVGRTLTRDQERKGGRCISRLSIPGSSAVLSVFVRPGDLLVGVGHSGAGPLDQGAIDQAQGHLEALAGEYGSTRVQLVLVDTSAGSRRFLEGQAAGLLCRVDVLTAGCATLAVAAYSEALVPTSPHIYTRRVVLQGAAELSAARHAAARDGGMGGGGGGVT